MGVKDAQKLTGEWCGRLGGHEPATHLALYAAFNALAQPDEAEADDPSDKPTPPACTCEMCNGAAPGGEHVYDPKAYGNIFLCNKEVLAAAHPRLITKPDEFEAGMTLGMEYQSQEYSAAWVGDYFWVSDSGRIAPCDVGWRVIREAAPEVEDYVRCRGDGAVGLVTYIDRAEGGPYCDVYCAGKKGGLRRGVERKDFRILSKAGHHKGDR